MAAQAVAPVVVVFLHHGRVGAVAAAGKHDAVGHVDGDVGAVDLLSGRADDLPVFIRQQRGGGGFGVHGHARLFGAVLQDGDQLRAGGNAMGARPHGAQNGEQVAGSVRAVGGVYADAVEPLKRI